MKSYYKRGGKFALVIIGGIFLVSLFTMLLWNSLMTTLFGLPEIGIFQAIGLLILFRLLFGNIGRGHWGREGRHMMWRKKWSSMSKEERETFRNKSWGWGKHHHHHCEPDGEHSDERDNGKDVESDISDNDNTATKDEPAPKSV